MRQGGEERTEDEMKQDKEERRPGKEEKTIQETT